MDTLKSILSSITVGDPIAVHNLTMFPLRGPSVPNPGYVTLDKAVERGGVRVAEVGSGTVPELMVTNSLEVPVFILDGEELVGAKQNRVVNLSILVPARTELKIPVTCIEAGRWHFESPEFRPAERLHHSQSRARRSSEVTTFMCMSMGSARYADQGAAWRDVDELLNTLDVEAPTRALSDAFDHYASSISEYVERLKPQDGQTGACFAINDRLVGLDLFDSTSTLAVQLSKVGSSYAMDALAAQRTSSVPGDKPDVPTFLEALASAPVQSFKAIGEGMDLRIQAPGLAGGGLEAWGRLVHLCAFRLDDGRGMRLGAMRAASERRARRLL